MASLADSLMEQLQNRGMVDQIAGKLGVPPGKASSAISAAVPTILAGLAKQTERPEGAAALAGALDRDHDGSALDDGHYVDAYEQRKGDKILGHVFGEKTPAVESRLAAVGGLDVSQGAELMKMLAPLVMGYLGKQKSGGGLDISALSQILGGGAGGLQLPGGLGDLLDGLGGSGESQSGSATATKSKSPNLGGMIGKFFKKKQR